jgi:hypothetical protein
MKSKSVLAAAEMPVDLGYDSLTSNMTFLLLGSEWLNKMHYTATM